MARITPTVSAVVQNSVYGDRRIVVADLAIAGSYASASAAAGGVKVTPALLGLASIESVDVVSKFTADAVEESASAVGPATGTDAPAYVLALSDKNDNLECANAKTISTGLTARIRATGR